MRQHVGATCLDKRGRLLSHATNSYKKTHPLQAYFAKKVGKPHQVFLHAEIAAILAAKGKKIHKIVIFRRDHVFHRLALAKPCPICQEAIKAFGIKHVEYSTNNGTWEHIIYG